MAALCNQTHQRWIDLGSSGWWVTFNLLGNMHCFVWPASGQFMYGSRSCGLDFVPLKDLVAFFFYLIIHTCVVGPDRLDGVNPRPGTVRIILSDRFVINSAKIRSTLSDLDQPE